MRDILAQEAFLTAEEKWLADELATAFDAIDKAKAIHVHTNDLCYVCAHSWPCPTWQALNPTGQANRETPGV